MKCKMLALILSLTVVSWAQTPTQSAPSTPQQSTAPAGKARCPCRAKMATGNAKDAHAWCAHHEMGAPKIARTWLRAAVAKLPNPA
jgi:hypothetical protein